MNKLRNVQLIHSILLFCFSFFYFVSLYAIHFEWFQLKMRKKFINCWISLSAKLDLQYYLCFYNINIIHLFDFFGIMDFIAKKEKTFLVFVSFELHAGIQLIRWALHIIELMLKQHNQCSLKYQNIAHSKRLNKHLNSYTEPHTRLNCECN